MSCPSCERALTFPPSVTYLLRTYPDAVTPQYGLNRHIARCKHCDLVAANNRAIDLELPPPEHKSPVTKIEKDIEEAKNLISVGTRKAELESALARMRDRLKEVTNTRDLGIRKVWEEYWGIWGPEKSGIGSLYE